MITQEHYDQMALHTIAQIKHSLHLAEQVHPDIPMSVMISILADASLLNENSELFEQELLEAVKACRLTRYQMICNEATGATRH